MSKIWSFLKVYKNNLDFIILHLPCGPKMVNVPYNGHVKSKQHKFISGHNLLKYPVFHVSGLVGCYQNFIPANIKPTLFRRPFLNVTLL